MFFRIFSIKMGRLLFIFAALLGVVIGGSDDPYGDNDTGYDDDCSDKCTPTLQKAKIIPEFVDYGTPGDLKVVYKENTSVECGNQVSILETTSSPIVTINLERCCRWATLVMFDPDLPVTPSYLHWLVSNIPTRLLRSGFDKQAGTALSEYFPPATATGDHRYTFCVYCQNRPYRAMRRNGVIERANFNPRNFAKGVGLRSPEACNFMYVVAVPDLLKTENLKPPDVLKTEDLKPLDVLKTEDLKPPEVVKDVM